MVVIGLIVGAVFAVQHFAFGMRRAPFAYRQNQQSAPSSPSTPTAPQNNQSNPTTPKRPMPGRGYGYGPMMGRGPMMMNRGFGPYGMFMPFGMMGFVFFDGFFRLLLPLGVLALVAYAFYQLGKRAGASSMNATPSPSSNPSATNKKQK